MTYEQVLKNRKGVAGLEILVEIVAMLFMVGIIIMALTMAGSKLRSTVNASGDTEASLIINSTYQPFKTVPDWFPIIIVMGAIVVLILLLVLVIGAIRSAGLMGGGGA